LEVAPEATVLVEKDRYSGYYKDYVDRLVELGVIKKTHYIRSNELLSVRNLVMTSREEDSGMFSHAAVSLIRNTFTSLGAKVSAQADRKIFLTRRKRRFDNQDELEKIAEELGYELVDTEGMSVLSQIELFRSISAVVTNHGAGLTNLIYAHPGTRVVELFSNNWLNDCYFRLARQCEHQYDCMISAPGTSWGVIDVTEFRRKLT